MAEKTAFVTDKGKWTFLSLPFSMNISPSVFSYVLEKVLVQCLEYTLNYLDDIMVFSVTWESHFRHLKEVFKWLQDTDLKIKCSKCEIFKSKVHYLIYLVGTHQCTTTAVEGHCHKDFGATPEHRGIAALLRSNQDSTGCSSCSFLMWLFASTPCWEREWCSSGLSSAIMHLTC